MEHGTQKKIQLQLTNDKSSHAPRVCALMLTNSIVSIQLYIEHALRCS